MWEGESGGRKRGEGGGWGGEGGVGGEVGVGVGVGGGSREWRVCARASERATRSGGERGAALSALARARPHTHTHTHTHTLSALARAQEALAPQRHADGRGGRASGREGGSWAEIPAPARGERGETMCVCVCVRVRVCVCARACVYNAASSERTPSFAQRLSRIKREGERGRGEAKGREPIE